MTRGKVVLIPFPFDDMTATKVRPVVCLTEPLGEHRHVVVAFMTSRAPTERMASDLLINPDEPAMKGTGLRVVSTLRLHRLLTISTSLISRELGALPSTLMATCQDRLRSLFS
jgi:mRNA interferase MazF